MQQKKKKSRQEWRAQHENFSASIHYNARKMKKKESSFHIDLLACVCVACSQAKWLNTPTNT